MSQAEPKTFSELSYAISLRAPEDFVDTVTVGTEPPNTTVVGTGVTAGVTGVVVRAVVLGVGLGDCTVVVTTGELTTSPISVHRPTKSDENSG